MTSWMNTRTSNDAALLQHLTPPFDCHSACNIRHFALFKYEHRKGAVVVSNLKPFVKALMLGKIGQRCLRAQFARSIGLGKQASRRILSLEAAIKAANKAATALYSY